MKDNQFQLSLRRLFGVVSIFALFFAAVVQWFAYVNYLDQCDRLSFGVILFTIFLTCALIGVAEAVVVLPLLVLVYIAFNFRTGGQCRSNATTGPRLGSKVTHGYD
jgi:hypothetical protein